MNRVLVVDDDARIRDVLRHFLMRENYEVIEANNGEEALELLKRESIDLILLDAKMPKLNGFEVCDRVKRDDRFKFIPIVMLTAFQDEESKIKGIQLGVDDFLNKPANMNELLPRVKSLIKVKHLIEHLENTENVLFVLAKAVEAKDCYTEGHLKRMRDYCAGFAKYLGLSSEMEVAIEYAGILHDIGKIGISEDILAKSGSLTKEEFEEIKKHPVIGEDIVRPLRFAKVVAPAVRGHHERWDGSGYPDGLRGEEISLGARIVSIVDAFDAMTSDRPYRKAMSYDDATEILQKEKGAQWDAKLVDAFVVYLHG